MRKPRDFDSELKALAEKAKQLKERRVRDLRHAGHYPITHMHVQHTLDKLSS